MEYELGIDSFFGASHAMRLGGARHTHSFRVQASFVSGQINESGMVVGFRVVSDLLDAEAKKYANRFLNEIEPFTRIQATGENLATAIFRSLMTELVANVRDAPRLVAVTLWENPTSYVRVTLEEAA